MGNPRRIVYANPLLADKIVNGDYSNDAVIVQKLLVNIVLRYHGIFGKWNIAPVGIEPTSSHPECEVLPLYERANHLVQRPTEFQLDEPALVGCLSIIPTVPFGITSRRLYNRDEGVRRFRPASTLNAAHGVSPMVI